LLLLTAVALLGTPATAAMARSSVGRHAARGTSGEAFAPANLEVGEETLRRCTAEPVGYCGRLAVPLDYRMPAGPRISVAFRWYPASDPGSRGAAGTVVPVEGGPGYPSGGSVEEGYAPMYGPLLQRWNMLAVDNRGTGQSTPVDCPSLQAFSGPTATAAFQQAAGECAAALNSRWHYPGGAPVHASDLFTTAPATRDLAAVLHALGLAKVELYGDSYGSWFAQVFAARYPRLVRSLILDSTYSTVDLDPWYRSTVQSMPTAFDDACSRSPACAAAAAGSAWQRIAAVAELLRANPISGTVPGPTGALEAVSMNVVGLVDLVNDAAEDKQIYRDIDAADRALLFGGDVAPLLRLYAQRLAIDELYFSVPAREYSVGLYLAVSCLDYQQLFSMQASPAARAQELAEAEASLPAEAFSPFSTAEWLQQDQNTEAYSACLGWPSPTVAEAPLPGPPPLFPSSLPVLVLGGELDTWTPPVDHPKILGEIGGHSRFIEIANSTHVVGEGETVCGSALIQRCVEHPRELDSMDASCAASAPAIHAVGVYPLTLAQEQPAQALAGNMAGERALRLAAAAVETAGDALARLQATGATLDHGLAGGTVHANHAGSLLTLQGDELIPGVAVSGTVRQTPASEAVEGNEATATLTVSAPDSPEATLSASWTTAGSLALAEISGSVGSEQVLATVPAP
jgi:pimeloyl-ACP methyl ester carboxylesterase